MTALCPPEGPDPLTPERVRAIVPSHDLWVYLTDTTSAPPPIRPGDVLLLTSRRTAIGVVERSGKLELEPSPADAIAWVRAVWRHEGQVSYDLDGLGWRTALRAGGTALMLADLAQNGVARARKLTDNTRLAARAGENVAANGRAYGAAFLVAAYAQRSWQTSGLWESEQKVADGWLPRSGRILDVGCGAGREAFGFAARGLDVVGVDPCARLIDAARAAVPDLAAGRDLRFVVGHALAIDEPRTSFDAAYVASDVYSSIPGRASRVALLARLRELVKPGAPIAFPATPLPNASRFGRALIDLPRALARPLLGARVPETGDRWLRSGPELPDVLIFKHLFRDDREVEDEIAIAGLELAGRTGPWFVVRAPRAPERFRRPESVAAKEVEGDLLLVHLDRGGAFRLNGTGRAIFDLAANGVALGEIARRVASERQVDPMRVESEARALVDQLAHEGLLEPVVA
jgi:SAM-dependent methyltransferase